MKNLLSAINLAPNGGYTGPGALGNPAGQEGALFDKVISTTIGLLTSIIFIWFAINFLIAALGWITAGNDKGKVEEARGKLTNNLIGLVITIAAMFIVEFMGSILNIPILQPTSILGL